MDEYEIVIKMIHNLSDEDMDAVESFANLVNRGAITLNEKIDAGKLSVLHALLAAARERDDQIEYGGEG